MEKIESNKDNERERKVLGFLKDKFNWITYLILAIIIWINVRIRMLPLAINSITGKPGLWDISRNAYTLGPDLDPFFFLRQVKTIVEQGSLPLIDTMKNFPLGWDTALGTKLLPYSIAKFHELLNFFSDKITVEYSTIIFPVVISVFITIAFFLLVRKIFEGKGKMFSNIIALIASLFLVTLPSLLARTMAGIPEKESLGFALMFFAFYFFLSAWKSEKIKNALILGIVAGVFTALLGLIWGGVIFVFITFAIAGFITLIFGKVTKKLLVVYSSWLFCSMAFWIPFTSRMGFLEFLTSSSGGLAFIIWLFIFAYFIMFKTKLKNTKILQNKIPKAIQAIGVSLLILFILSSIVLGPKALFNFGEGIVTKLSNPFTTRHSLTVAENKQPFFNTWRSHFGPIIQNIPLFFWLFFIGSVFLFYEMINKLKTKEKILLIFGYIFFLLALIFSRFSSTSILNGETGLSVFVYIAGYVILAGCFGYVFYWRHKEKESSIFKKINISYIFTFSLIFVGIIAGRTAVRLIMLLAPIAVIPLSYLAIISITNIYKSKSDLMKLFLVVFAILILISTSYTLYHNYQVITATAKNTIPNAYTWQWQEAMGWVRENTPKDAVFGKWWDYGYWLQTMGERATMLDGGNTIGYWNYLMGRHVLTADNESEALELLYNHNVTYFLIDSTDLGKYGAYSNIGSDENYDKLSWLGTFLLDETQTQETNNQTILAYLGGVNLDEDLIINEGKTLLPKRVAGVGAIIVTVKIDGEFEQPYAIFVYEEKQYRINLRYLFYNGKLIDFDSGIDGCAYIFPQLYDTGINPMGAAMFLSPRNMRALWVRLYLLEEGENFELVHTESNKVIESLRNQGINIIEIIYYRGFQGPIKIWKINYVGDEKYNEEYIQREYPERIAGRRDV